MKIFATLGAAALLLMTSTAWGQFLYTSTRGAQDQGINLTGWGSGTVAESDEVAYEGVNSIRISTRNFFQGGLIQFRNAVNVGDKFNDKAQLLLFTINIPGAGTTMGGGGGNAPGRGGAMAGGGGGAPGRGGAMAGDEGGATMGGGGGAGAAAGQEKPVTRLRVVVTTSDGKRSEGFLDVTTSVKDQRGWFKAGLPLQGISGLDKTNKQITGIAISADATTTMYVGAVEVTTDTSPIFVEPTIKEYNVGSGQEASFSAIGFAGATPVRFVWDFNAADGIQEEAEGSTVRRRFRAPGTYTVTVTGVDVFGLKKPFSATIRVTVN